MRRPFRQLPPAEKRRFDAPREESIRWLSKAQVDAFLAAGTDAFRLATSGAAWLEQFGHDLLLSFKSEEARDRLREELGHWCRGNGFTPRRLFGKFLPR